LFGCEVTKEKDYAKKVFGLIPTLKVLDGFNQYVAIGECTNASNVPIEKVRR